MSVNDLKWTRDRHAQALDLNDTLLNHTLANSQGTDTMTPEDMKIAIVALRGIVNHQAAQIDALFAHLTNTDPTSHLDKLKSLLKK